MKKAFSTIFAKIIKKEVKSEIVYETNKVLVFKDINPVSKVHLLVIPKKEIPSLSEAKPEDDVYLLEMLHAIKIIAKENVYDKDGYRVVINNGKYGGQTVDHIHFHLIAGQQLGWPPGVDSGNKKI